MYFSERRWAFVIVLNYCQDNCPRAEAVCKGLNTNAILFKIEGQIAPLFSLRLLCHLSIWCQEITEMRWEKNKALCLLKIQLLVQVFAEFLQGAYFAFALPVSVIVMHGLPMLALL